MSDFKPGDKVVCVNDQGPTQGPPDRRIPFLKKGRSYDVVGVGGSGMLLLNLPKPHDCDWFRPERFEKKVRKMKGK